MRFSKRFVPLIRKNAGKLWLVGFIIFAFIPNNPFFQNYFGTPVGFFIMLYVLWLMGRDGNKLIRKVSLVEPRKLKVDWVEVVIIVAIYIWLFSASLPAGDAVGFQVTYKWLKLIVVAFLWFNLGFRMGGRLKLPDGDNNELSTKAD